MATILLGAVGAFIGGGFGGTVLGLSGAVIGRAVGATLGRAIDARLMGAGSEPVEVGRMDRLRVMASGEGVALPVLWGRMRVGGQVIWAGPFTETVTTTGGGGKGAPSPTVTSYSYAVSFAVALCEGEITGIGRVWADGSEIDTSKLEMRVYTGSETQLPDPKIAAVLGTENAPAYRGTAYVVFENLALAPFGNRVPQMSFEVIRPAQGPLAGEVEPFAAAIRAVALIPGTGEYTLAERTVRMGRGLFASGRAVNRHSAGGGSDLAVSLRQLRRELPQCGSVSLVVSWFGDDLRCGQCKLRPKVEQRASDSRDMPWRSGGIARSAAAEVPQREGRPVYGGTPADAAVVEAIRAIRAGGQEVMFYPFILMDQLAGNTLPDPYGGTQGQPALPWRGRITLSTAPGRAGTPDRTAAAEAEVAAFFGAAQPWHFSRSGGRVSYSGPATDWGFRRFILHYAHLCVLAGGVDAFCIGSELRGLTEIRGAADSFPAVAALCQLAAEVRAILGPDCAISYAADWSEYSGFARDGNRYFHLDDLWSHPAVDFVGIDNYLPLTDWRDSEAQADAARSAHDLRYLMAGVEGGEGYDWYYSSVEGEAAQRREPITDDAGEPWIWRVKDMRNWWAHPHHPRIDGARSEQPTGWVPMSKPIRFTEYGCAAIDRGTNQPNLFFDGVSSESALPRASTGQRDDLAQMQYFRAINAYWGRAGVNPVSPLYGGPMIDMARAHAWAWDARPHPAFPLRTDVWSDGPNYERGHWLNGRATAQPVGAVVAEIVGRAGLPAPDLDGLTGLVRGFAVGEPATARAALQPLMLAVGFDVAERAGKVAFRDRTARVDHVLDRARLVADGEAAVTETLRASDAEGAARVRVVTLDAGGDLDRSVVEAQREGSFGAVQDQEVPLALLPDEAQRLADRWLTEVRVSRDSLRMTLPRSALPLSVGDVALLDGRRWRIDRIEQAEALAVEAVRVEPGVYLPGPEGRRSSRAARFDPAGPVWPVFLDLPLMTGQEQPHAPHLAVTAEPWPGRVALWSSDGGAGFQLDGTFTARAVIGQTQEPLAAARAGLWDRGPALRVRFAAGAVSAAAERAVLNGANLAAIGDGSASGWELFQFAGAEPVGAGEWALGMRLRGQFGSDAGMPDLWPAGSLVVLMTPAVGQISLSPEKRGLQRTWRIGDAAQGFDDADVVERIDSFDGIGLRPYSVAHLRARAVAGGTEIRWIRRTRVDGDSWTAPEVPLGEEREAYVLRLERGGAVLHEVETTVPVWLYPAAWRAADGPGVVLRVAQLSARFGAGPFRDLAL